MKSKLPLQGIQNARLLFIMIGLLVGGLVPFVASHITSVSAADGESVRFASFNASLNRGQEGQLITDLSTPDNEQAQTVAEIIQRTAPDVLLINEFDYDENGEAADLFRENYLEVSQNSAAPIEYPYVYVAPSNTGIPSGFNLDNDPDGTTDGPNDAFGFGFFPGQFGMVLYSKYPIDTDNVRTFQTFLWADMPDALLPDDPDTPEPADWFSPEELEVVRLSSKSHWDVPIDVDGTIIHALVSHPTPPVFDGPEDRNGTRNHDEIRFWADYVTPGQGDYIYDDSGETGGLTPGARFVIMGDQNADPFDGDSTDNAILQLLDNPFINTSRTPTSEGAVEQSDLQGGANETHEGNPAFDTADFSDSTPGNLRVDYVLPSKSLGISDAQVFWPLSDDPLFDLVGVFDPDISGFPSSDHRLVWVDVLPEIDLFAGNTLTLLHNNDGESGLLPTTSTVEVDGNPLEVPVGGIAAFSSVAEREIADAQDDGHSTVMVYAGDAFLASATIQCSLDPGEPIYDAIGQRQIPYDAHVLGNHEFDYTPDFLKRFIEEFDDGSGLTQPFLSANLDFSGEAGLSDINELVDADGLIELPITDGNVIGGSVIITDELTGQEFGIIGVTTPFLDSISSPRNVTVKPDTVAVVQDEIDRLIDEQGVTRIILVSHLQDVDNDQELIEQLVGVDVAVAGGGDDFLLNSSIDEDIQRLPGDDGDKEGEYPLEVTDAAGRTVYVVTGTDRYRYLGRLDVVFDDAGEVIGVLTEKSYPRRVLPESDAAETLGVDDTVEPDANIVATVNEPVQACLDELGEEAIATTEILLEVSRDGVRGGENNTGNLVADAFIYAYDKYNDNIGLPDPSTDNPVVAIQNGGGIRQNAGDVLPRSGTVPGPITVLDTIDVLPFLNFISVIEEVSPEELLEELGNIGTSGVYHVANLRLNYGTVEEDGETRYVIEDITLINPDGSETPLIENGQVVPGAPNVTVVTNSFVADREFEDNPNQTLLEDDQGVRLVYEQPLREYLQDPAEQGALGGLIAADDPRYQSGGEGRIVISDEPPDLTPEPQPGSGLTFQCEPRTLDIVGTGMWEQSEQSLEVPGSGEALVQLAGSLFWRSLPEGVTFTLPDGSTVNLEDPTFLLSSQANVGRPAYSFETLSPTGTVSVQVTDQGNPTASALVAYTSQPADDSYSGVTETTLEFTWGGRGSQPALAPATLELTLPAPLAETTDLTVEVAVMDVNGDGRSVILSATAGDVEVEQTLTEPNQGDFINIETLVLEQVPAGTEQVEVSVVSPADTDGQLFTDGDSVVLLGATAIHPCGDNGADEGDNGTDEGDNGTGDDDTATSSEESSLAAGNVSVIIPAGAVSESTTFTLTSLQETLPNLPVGKQPWESFLLSAETSNGTPVTSFAQPARIEVTYRQPDLALYQAGGESLSLMMWNETTGNWQKLASSFDGQTLTSETTQPGVFAVLSDAAAPQNDQQLYLPVIIR